MAQIGVVEGVFAFNAVDVVDEVGLLDVHDAMEIFFWVLVLCATFYDILKSI